VTVAERAQHWEGIYASNPVVELSWYEREPARSLQLVGEVAPGLTAAVVDIGAGASSLVDRLLARGFTDAPGGMRAGCVAPGNRQKVCAAGGIGAPALTLRRGSAGTPSCSMCLAQRGTRR